MLRSEVNSAIERAKTVLKDNNFHLPAFAFWSPEEWRMKGAECREIRDCRLGWDVTDFASDDFAHVGLVAFTLRNGHPTLARYRSTIYCEKVLLVGESQRTPMHRHAVKQEDIVCRAGGRLVVQVNGVGPDGRLSDGEVTLVLDGVMQRAPAGHRFVLEPGQSIRLTPEIYHEFYADPGGGVAVVGEVSTVNDDVGDNIFLDAPSRFSAIVEDAAPAHLLCNEY